ncbi:uncharacterized protein FFE2_16076 [Fusarium fujikuroi]|nr:uncharacterized protein FFE2_16076 [Fusarium fujikuroi]
MSHRINPFQSI